MTVYIVTLFLAAILGELEYRQRLANTWYLEDGSIYQKKTNIYYVLIVSVFFFVGGFRYQVGSDFYSYYAGWSISWSDFIYLFRNFDEPLLYLLTNVCRLIWNEGIFVIFVENAITVLLVFKGIREWEHESWTMPLLLYIMYCGWIGSFNGVRQAMAGAIIFAFSKRADEHWIIKYIFVCFIAFLVHRTAIFLIPILFLANRRFDPMQIVALICVAFILPMLGNFAMDVTDLSLESNYASHSVNVIRVVVSFVPVVLIIFAGSEFRANNSFLVNMAVINAMITFSTKDSALMYRFSSYTNMYLMLFIPKLANIFSGSTRRVFKMAVILMYFIYFTVEVKSGNGNLDHFQWAFGHFGRL